MPHIVLKRSDIPAGTLQVLDLLPNSSQRNPAVDAPGQTRYVNPVLNDAVVARGTTPRFLYRQAQGLAAWIITNVAATPYTQATGTITIAGGNLSDGDYVVVGGIRLIARSSPLHAFEFLIGSSNLQTASNLQIAFSRTENGFANLAYATVATNVVTLHALPIGDDGNAITLTKVGANIAVSGATLAGGVSTNAITTANANTIAANILANLVRYGNLTAPAVAATLAAVNAQIAAIVGGASITSTQHVEVLDILAGRRYIVPKNVKLADAGGLIEIQPARGAAGGPYFADPSIRNLYNSGALNISWMQGQIHGFRDNSFVYLDTAGDPNGEAVVVYDDAGELFVPTL